MVFLRVSLFLLTTGTLTPFGASFVTHPRSHANCWRQLDTWEARRSVIRAVDPNLWIPDAVQIDGTPILETEAHLRSWLGFLGGFTGVIGTLLTYEVKRYKMKQRIQCPFCEGTGVLTCAKCLNTGRIPSPDGDGEIVCDNCGGIGVVSCVICKGEGTSVPITLQRKELAMPEDDFDLALEDMGIAALAANFANQEAKKRYEEEIGVLRERLASEENEKPALTEVDTSGRQQ
jgi:hypothetical protein